MLITSLQYQNIYFLLCLIITSHKVFQGRVSFSLFKWRTTCFSTGRYIVDAIVLHNHVHLVYINQIFYTTVIGILSLYKKRSGTSQIGNHDLCARIFIEIVTLVMLLHSTILHVWTIHFTMNSHETWSQYIDIGLISKRLNLKLFFLFIMSAIFIFIRSENIYFTWYLFV